MTIPLHTQVERKLSVENNTFCDVNKTRVKGLSSRHDSTIEDESEIKNKTSYAGVVKGKGE
jgi:hypothetical protein